ncbi:Thiol-disulfide isomerase or thioredoxin [Solilutibacter tolerans]|uniref:Thiol-disulfide isomerase or thioredoxin n=2 Tax=Solilutibacter tolerans TaxID=1604334 RepID=A0A1N6NBU7_9GAMM|nr:Thiol-disulfide isomerase or thioredoxin [Lysobacter tolerans]
MYMSMSRCLQALMLTLCVLIAPTVLAAEKQEKELPPSPGTGTSPPPDLGKDRNGNPVDLSRLKGKVVIVTFWASWCGPCRKELPVLGHFQKVVGRDALEVIAVNHKEDRRDFINVVRANRNIDLTWVPDSQGKLNDAWGVRSIPRMFIIDREGHIALRHIGYSEESLPGIIDEILSLLPEEVKSRPGGGQQPNSAKSSR